MSGSRYQSSADAGGKKLAATSRFEVTFEDNRKLADVLGEFDANLALLENRTGIHAVAHGNIVVLEGDKEACLTAKLVLETLYERARGGLPVGPGDVDGAIRHALMTPQPLPGLKSPRPFPSFGELKTSRRTIIARTPTQSAYIKALQSHDMVFATGPAGTGKTYLAVAYAACCLGRGDIQKIILSRPAVEAGERLGFLPGDMREKVDPYLRPLYDALYDVLGQDRVERGLDKERAIEIAPLAFMRGRTLSNAIVILDEAQNCTPMQMKMFLTRLGEGSKMVITGDPTQVDLPLGVSSGLTDALRILEGVDGIAHVAFSRADVVRHPLVGRIIEAYETSR